MCAINARHLCPFSLYAMQATLARHLLSCRSEQLCKRAAHATAAHTLQSVNGGMNNVLHMPANDSQLVVSEGTVGLQVKRNTLCVVTTDMLESPTSRVVYWEYTAQVYRAVRFGIAFCRTVLHTLACGPNNAACVLQRGQCEGSTLQTRRGKLLT